MPYHASLRFKKQRRKKRGRRLEEAKGGGEEDPCFATAHDDVGDRRTSFGHCMVHTLFQKTISHDSHCTFIECATERDRQTHSDDNNNNKYSF